MNMDDWYIKPADIERKWLLKSEVIHSVYFALTIVLYLTPLFNQLMYDN